MSNTLGGGGSGGHGGWSPAFESPIVVTADPNTAIKIKQTRANSVSGFFMRHSVVTTVNPSMWIATGVSDAFTLDSIGTLDAARLLSALLRCFQDSPLVLRLPER